MKKNLKHVLLALLIIVSGFEMAYGCSGCTSQYTKAKLDAYMLITVVLSGLPLIFGGGLIGYFYFKSKKRTSQS